MLRQFYVVMVKQGNVALATRVTVNYSSALAKYPIKVAFCSPPETAGTQELFNGKIAFVLEYVQQGILIFDDIRDLLERLKAFVNKQERSPTSTPSSKLRSLI
jgi:hypothetical protein